MGTSALGSAGLEGVIDKPVLLPRHEQSPWHGPEMLGKGRIVSLSYTLSERPLLELTNQAILR